MIAKSYFEEQCFMKTDSPSWGICSDVFVVDKIGNYIVGMPPVTGNVAPAI